MTANIPQDTAPVDVKTTLRLDEDLWKKVKLLAIDRRMSVQAIVLEAVTQYLDREKAE